jgi:hypothetical protein
MSDLGFMFNANGPAYLAGQARDEDALNNLHKGLQNQTLQAQLPGVQGQAATQAAQGQYDTQMLPTKLQVGQSDANTKIDANTFAQMGELGEKANTMACILDTIPPAARGAAFQKYAGDLGFPTQGLDKALQNVSPDTLPDMLRTLSSKITQGTAKYQTEMARTNAEQAGANTRNTATNAANLDSRMYTADSRVQSTQITADARMEAERIKARTAIQKQSQALDMAMTKLTPDQRISLLQSIPEDSRTPDQQATLDALKRHEYTRDTLRTPDLAPQVMTGGTPTTPQERVNQAMGTPAARAVDPAVQQGAKEAWGAYEPTKYEYRMSNGKLQRKPK